MTEAITETTGEILTVTTGESLTEPAVEGMLETLTEPATETTDETVTELVAEPTIGELLGDVRCTDCGNAERLAFLHGDKLRWSPSMGWLQYGGARWRPVDEAVIAGLARGVSNQLFEQAGEERDDAGRSSMLASWGLESQKASAIRAMASLLRSEAGIMVDADSLDADPWLLNTEAGTIDLRTGRLRTHNPRDLITKLAGAAYDPEAVATRWAVFVNEIMDGDRGLVGYLQRFAGYCLTGDTSEQIFLFCSGSGANGKSVFLEVLASVLGDYATPLSPTALVVKHDATTNELASLRGARLAYCAEIEAGKVLDAGLMKALTGGDSFRVRHLYKEYFTLKPQLKLAYNANGQPRVRDSSFGFWRRCRHVPFSVSFVGERCDPRLREKLEEEKSGILNWALAGLRMWRESGLREPEAVLIATSEYRDDQSIIRAFLDETTKSTPGLCVPLADLHAEYQEWAKRSGERGMTNRRLKRELEQAGLSTKKGMIGVLVEGLTLETKG